MVEFPVVRSLRGRDAGRFLAVIGQENGKWLLADGKERPLHRPKHKNVKHIATCNGKLSVAFLSDKSLRRALRCFGEQKEDVQLCPKKM